MFFTRFGMCVCFCVWVVAENCEKLKGVREIETKGEIRQMESDKLN